MMVYQFMEEHQKQYSIREMAAIFGVSSSAYYKWAKREASTARNRREAKYETHKTSP
jgi:transposase